MQQPLEVEMNRNLLIIFVMIVSLLTGCVEEKGTETTKQTKTENVSKESTNTKGYEIQNATPVQFKVGEQEFEIIPFFEPILEYIEKVKESSEPNHKELYTSTVVEPFRKMAFGETGGVGLEDKFNFFAPLKMEKLNESIILLDKNYDHISHLIKDGLENSAKLLPGGKKTIYLLPFNPDQGQAISFINGVTAFATPEQFIVLQIAPHKYKEEMIPYVISHEYHHTVYTEKIKNHRIDIIDYVLVEGKADSFASLIYPNMNLSWTAELPPEELQNIWNWAHERRYSFDENDLTEMRAGNRIIPQSSDYRLGYGVMQHFLKNHPDVPIHEWTFMSPDEILEKSGFQDYINNVER
jgi:uncharacterized protein YjaZ